MKMWIALLGICLFGFMNNTELCAASAEQSDTVSALDKKINELKVQRNVAKRDAYLAGNKADMVMETDWIGYRQALAAQAAFQQQVNDLDAQIAALEKQRAQALGK